MMATLEQVRSEGLEQGPGAAVDDAIAFPGQGVTGEEIAEALGRTAGDELVAHWARLVGGAHWDALDYTDPRILQPAIFVAGLALARRRAEVAPLAIGHSLGELTAFTYAGAMAPEVGLEVVIRRAEICFEEDQQRPGRMVALVGVDPTLTEWLRRRTLAETGGVLDVAAWNGPTRAVMSGDERCIDRLVSKVGEVGVIAARLPIGGGFHSPLMSRAADRFAAYLEEVPIAPPRIATFSTVLCAPVTTPEEVRLAAVRGLVAPVRWLDSLRLLRAQGVRSVLEPGPGITLAKISKHGGGPKVRAADPPAVQPTTTDAVADPAAFVETLEGARGSLLVSRALVAGLADFGAGPQAPDTAAPLVAGLAVIRMLIGASERLPPHLARGFLHAEQRLEFSAAIRPDETLATSVVSATPCSYGIRGGLVVETRGVIGDADVSRGTAVLVLPGARSSGSAVTPQDGNPDRRSRELILSRTLPMPEDLPQRYAELSGDFNPIHLDEAAAVAAGLPGRILQGMCLLIMAGAQLEGLSRRRLCDVHIRFARPILAGVDAELRAYAVDDPQSILFDVVQSGHRVVKRAMARFAPIEA